nr:nucleotide exchange factor GrpE [Actinopolymorpha rutila]
MVASAAEVDALKSAVVERTNDLKRLQAEYVNYKRRVDRDRQANQEQAVGSVLTELLPVLDDIGRAREHEELSGGFKAVAEALETSLSKLGLVKFGEVGEEFDPRVHDALMHAYSDDVSGPTCSAILQPGYRLGERVLRPARVAVTEPTVGLPPEQAAPGEDTGPADDEGATAGADDQPPTGNG